MECPKLIVAGMYAYPLHAFCALLKIFLPCMRSRLKHGPMPVRGGGVLFIPLRSGMLSSNARLLHSCRGL